MMKSIPILFLFILALGFESYGSLTWTQKANMPAVARHRTTSFAIGNKGYFGLGHYNSGPNGNVHLADFWEYDQPSNTWTQKADFGGGPRYHAVGDSYGKKAYVGTGRSPGNILMNDWWEFDPVANTWTQVTPMPGTARRGAVTFKIDSLIFVGTGQVPSGFTNDFYAYDAANDQWLTNIATFPGSPRTSAVAFSIEDKGYVGTGGTGCGTIDFYEYKYATNTWVQRANVGSKIRNEAVGFAVNGRGYIGTGDNCSSGDNYKDMWEYNPQTNSWVEIEEFAGAARRYLDVFVIGKKVYCGLGTSGVNYNDLWEFDQTLSILKRDRQLLKIKQYPNPATSYINISIEQLPQGISPSDLNYALYDYNGRLIISEGFTSEKLTIDCTSFNPGQYIGVIHYNAEVVRSDQIIIL